MTNWGGHFGRLAEGALSGYRVLAPDLLGHGSSPPEPPWSIRAQTEAILATVGEEPAIWIGHSFGGRIAFDLAAARPELVERLVLLDPAIVRDRGPGLLTWAEQSLTRVTYATYDELIDRRYEESLLTRAPRDLVAGELHGHVIRNDEGRFEYRYLQSMLVATWSEIASALPAFDAIRCPTLLVTGETTYVPFDNVIPDLRSRLSDRLEVVTVPGGHTVLWDALPETAAAVSGWLARTR